MEISDEDYVLLASLAYRDVGAEFALVLESRGIEVRQEMLQRSCLLRVPRHQLERALFELEQYRVENTRAVVADRPEFEGAGWPGVIVFVAVIVAILVPVSNFLFGRDWLAIGRVDGAAMRAGEWWRAITALTLHADAAHLLGNAGFGSFFGFAVGRALGGGVGWLLIVMSGAVANLINAWVSGAGHRSIGASTAVFAALGILTAYSWRTGRRRHVSWRQRIAPVIAGLGLLAFTGSGSGSPDANVDIGAHLFGFLMGAAAGLGIAQIGPVTARRTQITCGAVAMALVASGWVWAIVS